jgi:hypothetical protein
LDTQPSFCTYAAQPVGCEPGSADLRSWDRANELIPTIPQHFTPIVVEASQTISRPLPGPPKSFAPAHDHRSFVKFILHILTIDLHLNPSFQGVRVQDITHNRPMDHEIWRAIIIVVKSVTHSVTRWVRIWGEF